jgi:hypothetical protein
MHCDLVLDKSESTISVFGRFTHCNTVSGVHRREGWVGPRVGLDLEMKIKVLPL